MSKTSPIAIEAGTLYTPLEKIESARVIIEGNSITQVGSSRAVAIPSGAVVVDAKRWAVTPGFIDPHVHGAGGADVMEGTFDALNTISKALVRHGTTCFLPTTVSSPRDVLSFAIETVGGLLDKPFAGARPAGIHLEGPFINAFKRGTHKAANVLAPDVALFQKWIAASGRSIRLVTVAPEVEGMDAILETAKASSISVAMGHSNATFEEAQASVTKGVVYAVHTFNAMREFTHRDPGIVGLVLSEDRVFAEIIADGIHVNPEVIRIFARAKGRDRVLLVTDAISATDMPDGCYRLGQRTVNVAGGACRDTEGRLAGSTLTQERALRNFVEWSGFSLEQALLGLTVNPARVLKLQKKGVLEPGADADITILDESLRVVKTWVAGRLVYG